jgi:hypothetical protein
METTKTTKAQDTKQNGQDEDDGGNDDSNEEDAGSDNAYRSEDKFTNAHADVDELLELIFHLSITFSSEEFADGQSSSQRQPLLLITRSKLPTRQKV